MAGDTVLVIGLFVWMAGGTVLVIGLLVWMAGDTVLVIGSPRSTTSGDTASVKQKEPL